MIERREPVPRAPSSGGESRYGTDGEDEVPGDVSVLEHGDDVTFDCRP